MKNKIFVTFEIEGIHRHNEQQLTEEYMFLSNRHRHVFHVKVFVDVFHDDREIEFIKLKEDIVKIYQNQPIEFDNNTAETIAKMIFQTICEKFEVLRGRKCTVVVSEDGENGGVYNGILWRNLAIS